MEEKRSERSQGMSIGRLIVSFLVSAVVLAIVAFLTPGFSIANIWSLLIAAALIGIIDYAIERITGLDAKPFGRGIIGFIVSAVIIYITGMLVVGVSVSIWGAIIAALLIGVINAIIPGRQAL